MCSRITLEDISVVDIGLQGEKQTSRKPKELGNNIQFDQNYANVLIVHVVNGELKPVGQGNDLYVVGVKSDAHKVLDQSKFNEEYTIKVSIHTLIM